MAITFPIRQSGYETDPHILEVFKGMDNRIQAMALVHNKLYQSRNLSSIDLGEYVDDLGQLLRDSYEVLGDRVSIVTEVESISVFLGSAMPCGIVLNELVSNSFKHGFPGDRRGTVRIRVSRDEGGEIEFRVSDDGIGIPPDFDARKNARLGLESVVSIVEAQLHGTIDFEHVSGFACRFRFSDRLSTQRV